MGAHQDRSRPALTGASPCGPWWRPGWLWLSARLDYGALPPRWRLAYHALLTVTLLAFLHALLPHPTWIGSFGDIRYFHSLWENSRTIIGDYGQFPWWDPYHCGGMPHAGNAQSMFLSPFFAFSLLLGTGVGMRAFLIAHFFVALYGGIALARAAGVRGPGEWLAGLAFACGGFFPERATGHVAFSTLAYLPWVIWAYRRAVGGSLYELLGEPDAAGAARPAPLAATVPSPATASAAWPVRAPDLRYALLAGLLVSLATWQGGVYPTPILILCLAAYAAVDVLAAALWLAAGRLGLFRLASGGQPGQPPGHGRGARPAWWLPLLVGLIAGAVYLSVGAIKWWPVLDFLRDYPRHEPLDDALSPLQLAAVFLRRTIQRHHPDYHYVFGEYRNYLGPVVVGLALASLRWWRRWWRFWLVALLFLGLTAGAHGAWSPYTLLKGLPIFESLRVPARYAIVVDLHLAVLAGWVLTRLLAWGASPGQRRGRLALAAGLVLFVGAGADLLEVNNNMFGGLFNTRPPAPARGASFRQAPGHGNDMFLGPLSNRGTVRCYEPNPPRSSRALRYDLPDEVSIEPQDAGEARTVAWSPNRVEVAYRLEKPGLLVLNQNHHRHWQAWVLAADSADDPPAPGGQARAAPPETTTLTASGGRPWPTLGGTTRPTSVVVQDWRGLVAARPPVGEGKLALVYRPAFAGWAWLLTLEGLLACALAWLLLPALNRRLTPAGTP